MKRTPLKRSKPLKRSSFNSLGRKTGDTSLLGSSDSYGVSSVPKVGKRGKKNRLTDAKTRNAYVVVFGPNCEFCGNPGEHLHHVRTKAAHPNLRHDRRNLVLLCVECHLTAHRHPAWARDMFRAIRPTDAEEIGIGAAIELGAEPKEVLS